MARRGWLPIIGLIVLGGVLGAGALLASVEVNRHTSTDAFCTSCHSMKHVAADPSFSKSKHRSNTAGVVVGCADCHIPTTNWFVETYVHVSSGIRDVWAETTQRLRRPGGLGKAPDRIDPPCSRGHAPQRRRDLSRLPRPCLDQASERTRARRACDARRGTDDLHRLSFQSGSRAYPTEC